MTPALDAPAADVLLPSAFHRAGNLIAVLTTGTGPSGELAAAAMVFAGANVIATPARIEGADGRTEFAHSALIQTF